MKKVSCVVMDKDREASLKKLREAGVLHIEKKKVSSDALALLLGKQGQLQKAMGLIRRYTVKADSKPHQDNAIETVIQEILALGEEKKQLQEKLGFLTREQRRIESWGEFDPEDLEKLAAFGINLIPYELPLRVYQSIGDDIKLIVLSMDKIKVKALAFSEIPGFPPLKLPELSLSGIGRQILDIKLKLETIEKELKEFAFYQKELEEAMSSLQKKIEFEVARAGMDMLSDTPMETTVSWLSGYIPHDKLDELKQIASSYSWALAWDDPAPEDKPPTLVKNNPFVRIIHPLFSFLGTVPGYREYDISMSYLIFFCLFFSMIFGDAAYGLLLLVLSFSFGLVYKIKNRNNYFPDAAKLFMLLSFCTVIWGAITGSWFSMPKENLPHFLQALIIPPFNDKGELSAFPLGLQNILKMPAEIPIDELKTRWNIQFLCFTVGMVQLVWGRGKNILKQLSSLTALAQAGWLILMIGLYFLVLFMLLKIPLPPFAVYLIVGGLVLYFVFAEQNGGNFFKNIGKSFTNFLSIFLTAVGSFADIISYIRLFAVGLAGSTIASSFNTMAIPAEGFGALSLGFVLRIFAAILILIFGHALNIVMNGLSVVVHGVRLNLLEYAGNHLGMEWSGYAYKPFKE